MSGSLQIVVVRANGVLNRDTFGKSDPYCIVLDPQGKTILTTNTIDDTLDPVWPAAKATVNWPVVMNSGAFRFHLFDEDVGEDEFLGEGSLPVADMLSAPRGERTLKLTPRPNEPDKEVRKKEGSLGTVTVAWTYTAPPPSAAPAPVAQPATANRSYPPPPQAQPLSSSGYPQPNAYPQPVAPQPNVYPQPVAPQPNVYPQPVAPQPNAYPQPVAPQPNVYPQPVAPQPNAYPQPVAPQPNAYPQPYNAPVAPQVQSGSIRIVVKRGNQLANVDAGLFGGGESDPYVQVMDPAGREILKTKHINNTLNPTWSADTSTATWTFTSPPSGNFKFLVWDDETAGSDQFMGEAVVNVTEFLKRPQGEDSFKLCPRSNETDKKLLKLNGNLGTLTVSWQLTADPPKAPAPTPMPVASAHASPVGYPGGPQGARSGPAAIPRDAKLKLFVRRAAKLLNRDGLGSGVSDPYVIVKDPSGREIIHTKPINDDLNPEFPVEQATVEWPIPPQYLGGAPQSQQFFNFTVWDYDPVGGDEFLGEAFMSIPDMVRTQHGENAVPLKPRQGEPDKEIQDNASNLGTLTVQWDIVAAGGLSASMSMSASGQYAPPLTFPGNLSVTIVRCAQLLNRESFGTSDPYVIAFGLNGEEVHRTPVIDGNLNPTFPTAKSQYILRLDAPQGMLRFHVFDKEMINDNFMGEGVVDVNAVLAKRGVGEIEIPLKARPGEKDKDIAKATNLGTLYIKAEFGKVTEVKREVDDGSRGLKKPPPLRQIGQRSLPGTLTVVVKGAIDLKNMELTGTSDPYCIAKGPSGDQLLKTPTVESSLRPEWPPEKSKFMLRLNETFFGGAVTFTIFDQNPMKDALMGEGRLPVQQILSHENGDLALPLGTGGSGELGFVILNVQYAPDSVAAAQPQRVQVQLPGTVVLSVSKANGLLNMEMMGTSDPYAVVIGPDGQQALKTPTASSTLNPTWASDKSKALVKVNDRRGNFTIQLWDENTASDDFMGEATIAADDLLSRPSGDITLHLKPRPSDPKKLQQAASLGTVTFHYSYLPGGVVTDQFGRSIKQNLPKIIGKGRMMLKVLDCKDLLVLDFTSSDPFIAVVVGGRRVYKSKVIDSNLNPVWTGSDATADFFLRDPTQPIFLEVYDHDTTSGDDFGGKVQLLPAQLEESGEQTLQLLDENMRADKNRGTIHFQWAFQRETLCPAAAGGARVPTIAKPGRLTVTVESCHSLVSRATMSDTPSVTAFYGGSDVFKTKPAKSLNPSWVAAEATFTQYISNPTVPLELHVQDHDKFQGMIALPPCDMSQQGRATLTLQPRPQEADKVILERQHDLGTMTVSWAYEEARERHDVINKPGSLKLRVISAAGLISQDTLGEMEVYAEVHANGKVVHSTKDVDYVMKKGSCEWMSGDGTTEVDIVDPSREVKVMLWDRDLTSSDFLGQVAFRPNENATSGETEMVLRPRPNEPDKNVANAPRLGHLRLSWLFTETKERQGVTTVASPTTGVQPSAFETTAYQQRELASSVLGGATAAPATGTKIRIRLAKVRGVRFDTSRQDPEVLVSLLYNAQELRTNPAVSDATDASSFPVHGVFTITPKPSDQLAFRVFDADDLWGAPLGVAYVKWEEALAASSTRGGPQGQTVFASPLVDPRGQPRGEVLYYVTAEEKTTSTGELRYEVRQAQDVSGIPSGCHVVCRTVVSGVEQFSKPVVALSRTIFFGASFSSTALTEHDIITIELMDAQSGIVYCGGSLTIGPDRKDGKMWLNLIQPATKQPTGTIYIEWKFSAAARRPLSEYVTPPDATSLSVVEVLQVKGFQSEDLHRGVSLQLEQGQQPLARSDVMMVAGGLVNVGHIFYAAVDVNQHQVHTQHPGSPQRGMVPVSPIPHGGGGGVQTCIRIVDEQSQNSMGDGVVSLGPTEVEAWITLNSGKQVLLRSVVVRGQSMSGQQEKNLVVRVKRVEPNQAFASGHRECVLALQVNPESTTYGAPSTQCTSAFSTQGVVTLDRNMFFPSHLFPRAAKRHTLEVSLADSGDAMSRLGVGVAHISRLRRGGDLNVDMHDGTRVVLSYVWIDLAGTQIGEVPSVKTITLVEANLRNNVTERFDALVVQLSSGGAPVRSEPSANPTPRNPRFSDQHFNIVEGAVTMPLRVTLFGIINGREDTIGVADITSEAMHEGRQLIPVRRRADEVASILLETTVTLSGDGGGNYPSTGIRRKGMGPRGDEGHPVKIQFVVGRPFGTRMEPHETLEVLKPYLARHFAVMDEEQQLMWNNKLLEWNKTVAQNKVRVGDDGVVALTLSSTNKRNLYLLVKTPSGKSVVVGAMPQSSVRQIKAQLTERDDTDLEGQPQDGIRLMCNYNELADDESLGFYRLQTGQALIALLKARPSRAGKANTLPKTGNQGRISLRVQDPHGEESIVQLSLTEPVSSLRSLLSEEDNVRSDIFIDDQRILREEDSLQSLGVCRTSMIQFVFKKFKLGSPERGAASRGGIRGSGARGFCTFDVEGLDGVVVKTEVDMDDPIASLRRTVASEPGTILCYNGRHIFNENRSFREIEAQSGGHFQVRFPHAAGAMDHRMEREMFLQRQRATESLQHSVVDLQRQLEAAKASQNAEKQLTLRVMNLERELDDFHSRYQNALDRVRELEDTIERQHVLLQRATTNTSNTSNPSFHPSISLRGGPLPLRPYGTPTHHVDYSNFNATPSLMRNTYR